MKARLKIYWGSNSPICATGCDGLKLASNPGDRVNAGLAKALTHFRPTESFQAQVSCPNSGRRAMRLQQEGALPVWAVLQPLPAAVIGLAGCHESR